MEGRILFAHQHKGIIFKKICKTQFFALMAYFDSKKLILIKFLLFSKKYF